jgi:3-oxoacyl-[acyl-carrier protein] reductase
MSPHVNPSRSGSLEGLGAVVTGAARGLGERAAAGLCGLGAAVGILDVDGEGAREAAERLVSEGGRVVGIRCDVANREETSAAFATVAEELGPVDILVSNAAVLSRTRFLDLEPDEWQRVISVNLTGVFNCARAAAPAMVERGFGRIVNVASVAGLRGGGLLGTAAYATAKAGVIGFTRALATELGGKGVSVTAVAPGAAETEMTSALDDDPALRDRVLETIPLGRRATVLEVADAIVLVAAGLPVGNGAVVTVDGGVLMA